MIILLPLFLMQSLYQLKYAYRFENLKEWVFAIFPVLTMVSCMLFPVGIGDGFSWDLRRIPFILGILYGGYKLGFILLFFLFAIRYFIGGNGFYLTLITISLLAVLVLFFSRYYMKMSLKQKLTTSCSLIFLSVLMSVFFSEKLFESNMGARMWVQYIVINVTGMFITTLLWEGIRNNFEVLQKLMKTEKLEVVSHLAASISHEVRNPLTVSRGFMQLSSDEELSPQVRKFYVDTAIQEMDRASEIINDYLTFARPEIDKKEKFNVFEEIQGVADILTPLANMNNTQLKVSSEKNEYGFVLGERKKFEQCLVNIIKNGIESMPDGGKLQIDMIQHSSTIQITIRDEGTGMTQEQINRLGEPYFTTKSKGTGLGMMVSFSIIKEINGKIRVESERGKGTCFTIELPVCN
ncbi:sensor histidine kinase [Domibacillus robiginosus]|uniref:sensor histidine kinase n=1 Tax=Domibacillus robiginosus TaxID=1071054 RepID=UPI001FDEC6E6|nr:HAMP domain-containing sensor histidine kinase [Domibacillus robiginosus]